MIDNTLLSSDGAPNGIDKLKKLGLYIDNAGFYIAFDTDATQIDIEATLRKNSGVDYIPDLNESGFQLLQLQGTEYKSVVDGSTLNDTTLLASLTYTPITTDEQKYILLFPTYNGIARDKDIKITVNTEATVYNSFPFNEDEESPILVYGTSVTQGASASTVRSNYTSILSFELKREVLNLGFRGSAFLDKQMADYLAKVPSHIFFIDVTLNLYEDETISKNRACYLIGKYRKPNHCTPIVVVSKFHEGNTTSEGKEGQCGMARLFSTKNIRPQLAPSSNINIF